jgi:hypothetical protein
MPESTIHTVTMKFATYADAIQFYRQALQDGWLPDDAELELRRDDEVLQRSPAHSR